MWQLKTADRSEPWTDLGQFETAMTFSIESEHPIAYERLDCVAYDLENDRAQAHPIRPLLIGTDGLSKKLSVPFLEPLTSKKRFAIRLRCTLPRAMKVGFGYYSSTLSFAQDRVGCCTVQLIFTGTPPKWMRVYEASPSRQPALVKSLVPVRKDGVCEYLDRVEGAPGQSARVYAFWRDSI